MPRTCNVCASTNRARIDAALVEGAGGIRKIAKRFRVTYMSLYRHRKNHLPTRLLKSHDPRESTESADLLTRLRTLVAETYVILRSAKRSHDWNTALRAIQRLERQIELEAEIAGELARRGEVNVTVNAEISRSIQDYLDALRESARSRESFPVVAADVAQPQDPGMTVMECPCGQSEKRITGALRTGSSAYN
jgi:transposase-like protein